MMQTLTPPCPPPTGTPQTWTWQGHAIHYVQAGDQTGSTAAGAPSSANPGGASRPPLLLVHGFGASTDHWKKNIADLQRDFEVWAIDLLGFGRSAKPEADYGGTLWREQLHDFIQAKIGRPTIIAGNSLGGYASLCVAAAYPDAVAGVVLLNSAGPFTPPEPLPEPTLLQRVARSVRTWIFQQPWVARLIFLNVRRRATVRKTLLKVYVDATAVTEELIDDIIRPAYDPGALQVFSSVFKAGGKGAKVDELLGQMQCPLLTLWGQGDPWMNVIERSGNFRRFYGDRLTEHFLAAGHCPHDEVPQQVDDLIRQWVKAQFAP
ncbi:MAG: alpha/beta fold hydrolase [Prochlorothrix sp.]|nr:alpha/beta fold hydrolase [Prochlorothrix sp.]